MNPNVSGFSRRVPIHSWIISFYVFVVDPHFCEEKTFSYTICSKDNLCETRASPTTHYGRDKNWCPVLTTYKAPLILDVLFLSEHWKFKVTNIECFHNAPLFNIAAILRNTGVFWHEKKWHNNCAGPSCFFFVSGRSATPTLSCAQLFEKSDYFRNFLA